MFMGLFLSLMQYLALIPEGLISSHCNQIIQDFSKRKLQQIPILRSQGQKPIEKNQLDRWLLSVAAF